MEELQEAREELAAVERELNMKSSQARERGGAELIRGDEVLKTQLLSTTQKHSWKCFRVHSQIRCSF